MMTNTPWLRLAVSLITATVLAGCASETHELGKSPDAGASSAAGSTGASAGAGGGGVIDAPVVGGSGGASAPGGATGLGGGAVQAGRTTMASAGSASAGALASSSNSMICCDNLSCPSGYTLIGPASSTCPAGAECKTFITGCGCDTVLCAAVRDGGVADTGGAAGSGGTNGSGGIGGPGGTNGSGGIGGPGGTNGIGGISGAGGAGGNSRTSSSSCPPVLSCNWCGGEYLKDANGCVTGFRCANGADPCKVHACSATAPCATGYTCSNMLCWPNDGGTGALCGDKVCAADQVCCGPAECGHCIPAQSGGAPCPDKCMASACGPSGLPCKTGEVCLDVIHETTTTRDAVASCVPNPCGSNPLTCACAGSLCGTTNLSCTLADSSIGAVVCSTK